MAVERLVPCIVDTGSQVTLFSCTVFERYVKGVEMQCAGEVPWLTIHAMNRLNLPYVGYAVMDFTVTGVMVPRRRERYRSNREGLITLCLCLLFPGLVACRHLQDDERPEGGPLRMTGSRRLQPQSE